MDASDNVEGPLKLAEDTIDRAVSIASENSSRSAVMIDSMSLQAAREVTKEEKVRVVRSTTRGQKRLNAANLASAALAILF